MNQQVDKGHSRDIYHTKRMQRLSCVAWSLDDRYIFTGSDEMNIRIWKAHASQQLGVVSWLLPPLSSSPLRTPDIIFSSSPFRAPNSHLFLAPPSLLLIFF